MSMIGDFLARSHRPLFFNQAEREQLRVATNLPERTAVCIGRHNFPDHIGFWGTNAWSLDKTVHAFITTVLVGHLVVQAVTLQCTDKWDGTEMTVNTATGLTHSGHTCSLVLATLSQNKHCLIGQSLMILQLAPHSPRLRRLSGL
jgi:hypothetical protein